MNRFTLKRGAEKGATTLVNGQIGCAIAPDSPASHAARLAVGSAESRRSKDAAFLWNHGHGHWFDLIWIIYSVFFFIEPIQRNNRAYWIQFGVVYLVFVGLYIGVIRSHSRPIAYTSLAAMLVLALWYFPINQSAAGMFVYVVAFAPFIFETVTPSILIFLGVAVSAALEGILLHMSPWSWGFVLVFSMAVGASNLVAAQRMRANQKLAMAHQELAQMEKVAERERIARDLHDVLGHTLSVIVLKTELARKLIQSDAARAEKEISDVEQISRTALAEVREAIRGYRSQGLTAEVDSARTTLDAAGVSLECFTEPPKLPPTEETVLSLMLREAVTNIVRHARASQCRIRFETDGAYTRLIVQDDGCGSIRHEGNGLRGMRERAVSLGGSLRIESANGTQLTVEFPARLNEA